MFPTHGNVGFLETETPNRIPFDESPGTESRGTSILAASWLENCLANHSGCKYQRDECQRPLSRLIDFEDANAARPPHVWGDNHLLIIWTIWIHAVTLFMSTTGSSLNL